MVCRGSAGPDADAQMAGSDAKGSAPPIVGKGSGVPLRVKDAYRPQADGTTVLPSAAKLPHGPKRLHLVPIPDLMSQFSSSAEGRQIACLLVGLALLEIRDQRAEPRVHGARGSPAPERASCQRRLRADRGTAGQEQRRSLARPPA